MQIISAVQAFLGGGVAHGVHQDANPKLVILPANAWDTFSAVVDYIMLMISNGILVLLLVLQWALSSGFSLLARIQTILVGASIGFAHQIGLVTSFKTRVSSYEITTFSSQESMYGI